MSKAIKGCTNEMCIERKKRTVFHDADRFCTRCGKPLSYVCKSCWKELTDDTQLYCEACETKRQNPGKWLNALAENGKHAGESMTETGRKALSELGNIRIRKPEGKAGTEPEIRISGAGTLVIPKDYNRLKKSRPANIDFSSHTTGFTTGNAKFRGYFLCYKIEEEEALSFENVQDIIDGLHEKMAEDTGLIEAAAGSTASGKPYAYYITKHALKGMGGIALGTEYLIRMNFRLEEGIACLEGAFTDSTINGNRNSDIFGKMSMDGSMDFDHENWECDPYDAQYRRGFRMNRSESAEYDDQYPDHPLSRVRKLASFMIAHN